MYVFSDLTFVIPSGSDTSDVLDRDDRDQLMNAKYMGILAPASLSGTITVEVSSDNSLWGTLQSGGTDISLASGKALTLDRVAFRYMRLKSSSNEGSERTFQVTKGIEDGRFR